ncbi:MAG: GNAT family N-acetyltransferase [Acidimicrobiaceae bacterium]|nr:GNAT family N-acetyltransferase [Acidimicrobiaceae bacterium]
MRTTLVRPAVHNELPKLRDIEWAAGQRYREFGLGQVADDEPPSIEVLSSYARDGRAWVAIDQAGEPIGYILVDVIDNAGHIEQVSVEPNHQGQGVGRALIDQAKEWAIAEGFTTLTLTTFGHIPWNRPLYEHLGFQVLSPEQIGPGVRALCDTETEHGLDPDLRVVMEIDLHP